MAGVRREKSTSRSRSTPRMERALKLNMNIENDSTAGRSKPLSAKQMKSPKRSSTARIRARKLKFDMPDENSAINPNQADENNYGNTFLSKKKRAALELQARAKGNECPLLDNTFHNVQEPINVEGNSSFAVTRDKELLGALALMELATGSSLFGPSTGSAHLLQPQTELSAGQLLESIGQNNSFSVDNVQLKYC